MKWSKKIGTILVISLQYTVCSQAQDLHFSQFFNAPLLENPANTGFIPDADYRLGASFRDQWSSILTAPYQTVSLFGDAQVLRDKLENAWLGLGGVILSDVAGTGTLRTTEAYASMAYHQMLGNSSLLTGGFNIGWANKRIDASKLLFPDQFNYSANKDFFDNTLPTSAVLNTTNVSYLDMQVGINYAYFPDDNTYINGGFSMQHVNEPHETFFTSNSDSSLVPIRYIGFINAILKTSSNVIINPNAYYTIQAKASELMFGLNLNYDLTGGGDKQLILGLYDRWGDAIIPMAGFELKNIRFTFSYDVTTSALSNFDDSQGAPEFSVLKKGFYGDNNNYTHEVLCPQF
jgi:type IX secretion system PorP/SprF family membrane protein